MLLMLTDARYFNRNRLDYPNAETTRASRKYVKAMKQLHVGALSHAYRMGMLMEIGIHPRQ